MKQINLYQSAFRPPKILLPARGLAISGVVFLAGLLALYAWGGWQLGRLRSQVEQVVQRADAVSRQVQAHAPGARQADPTLAMEAQTLEARVRALQLAQDAIASGALGAETGYAAQFRALARAVGNPASLGAWLTGITLSESGRALDLRGRALDGADPARLIANLRREPLFVGLSFAGLEVVTPQPKNSAQPEGQPDSKAPAAPRFLEFSLNARPAEPAAGAAAKQGSAP